MGGIERGGRTASSTAMEDTVGQSRRDALLGQSGWQKPKLGSNDKRIVLDLSPVMTLQEVRKQLSNRKRGDEERGLLRNGWTNKDAAAQIEQREYEARHAKREAAQPGSSSRNLRAAVMKPMRSRKGGPGGTVGGSAGWDASTEEMDRRFVAQVAEDARFGPAAAEARDLLGREKPALLQKIFAQKEREDGRSERRRFQLNAKGVFEAQVNVVRNRNMHRVDLRRGLTDAALTKEEAVQPIDPFKIPNSLEARMQDLLGMVTLIVDGPQPSPSFDTSLAGAAISMAMSHRQARTANLVASRMQDIESVTAQMLGRYRTRVREEQLKLLQDLGLDPGAPASWDKAVESMAAQDADAREQAEEDERSRGAEQRPRNTEELMEAVLNRLSQIEERMAQQEAEAAAQRADDQESVQGSEPSSSASSVRGDRSPSRLSAEPSSLASAGQKPPTARELADDGVRPRRLPDHVASNLASWTPQIKAEPSRRSVAASSTRSLGALSRRSMAAGEEFCIPDPEELDEAPVPRLPRISQLPGMTEADTLQARLERTWGMLEMPMMAKLDMVIKYTSKAVAAELEEALDLWEAATACVVERERLLGDMVDMQEGMDSGDIHRPLFTPQHIAGVSADFLAATHHARRIDAELRRRFDDRLTYQGMDYPGEDAVTDDQLTVFVQRAMQVAAVLLGPKT
eukprot:jgi/Tetstr1/448755/TSEL_035990.t1